MTLSDKNMKKANKFFIYALVILLLVLTLMAGLKQELDVYLMDITLEYATNAPYKVEISSHMPQNWSLALSNTHKAPMGAGYFACAYESTKEAMVIKEMTLKESIEVVLLFTALDLVSFCVYIYLFNRFAVTKRKLMIAFSVYMTLFCVLAFLIDWYCWGLLFGGKVAYAATGYTAMKLLVMIGFAIKIEKSQSVQGKKSKKQ